MVDGPGPDRGPPFERRGLRPLETRVISIDKKVCTTFPLVKCDFLPTTAQRY